jgi:selenocysteine lyase/cysteine desulfurase
MTEARSELERGVQAALETYSNVHRGSGHHSLVSTRLFEQARDIVLAHLGLGRRTHTVVFCTPRRAERLSARLAPGRFRTISSRDLGLSLGVTALAVERRVLSRVHPFESGGGTARLVAPGWVVWAKAPGRFEAGTPAIVNVVAFAKALRLVQRIGAEAFREATTEERTADAILREDALQSSSGRDLLQKLAGALIGREVRVPTAAGARPFINLDNAASTPTFTPVWEAVRSAWRQGPTAQKEIVSEVRSICAGLLGAPLSEYDVVFTSNTTEAINLAAEGLDREPRGAGSVVVNTSLEHNSNELPWRSISGVRLIRLAVDRDGFVDLEELEAVLSAHDSSDRAGRGRVRLVAVSGASNVVGAFNDLDAIGRIVRRHGARLLVDAAQLVAHRKVDMAAAGIDYLAFSAHKTYAPFGTGVLVVRKGLLAFDPEEMAQIQSSGEENIGGIAGLGKALVLLQRIGLEVIQEEERALTAQALCRLAEVPGLRLHGVRDPGSPRFARKGGVIAFSLKGRLPDGIARALAERGGIGVRWGCHCAHIFVKRLLGIPPLLERFQRVIVTVFPRLDLPGVVRVSLGIENTADDVDALVHELKGLARRPRGEAGDRPGSAGGVSRRRAKDVRRQMDEFAAAASRRVYGEEKTVEP